MHHNTEEPCECENRRLSETYFSSTTRSKDTKESIGLVSVGRHCAKQDDPGWMPEEQTANAEHQTERSSSIHWRILLVPRHCSQQLFSDCSRNINITARARVSLQELESLDIASCLYSTHVPHISSTTPLSAPTNGSDLLEALDFKCLTSIALHLSAFPMRTNFMNSKHHALLFISC